MDLEKNQKIDHGPDPVESAEKSQNEKKEVIAPSISKEDQIMEQETRRKEAIEISRIHETIGSKKSPKEAYKIHLAKEVVPKIGIQTHLKELLSAFRKGGKAAQGEDYSINCQATLELAIENGLAEPETIMFYTIAGVAEGILRKENLSELLGLSSQFPLLEYIKDGKGGYLDQKKSKDLIKAHFSNNFKSGAPGEDFRKFYWQTLSNEPRIRKKFKGIDSAKLDHDHLMWFMSASNGNQAENILKNPIREAGASNAYAGLVKWIEENRKSMFSDPENFSNKIAAFVAMDGILKGFAYAGDQGYLRLGKEQFGKVPRESMSTNHPDQKLVDHGNFVWDAIESLDKPLFGSLRSYDSSKWPLIQKRVKSYGIEVESIDKFYDRIDEVIAKVVAPGALSKWFGKYRKTANRLKAA
jgi:hypothetical protein